MSKSSCINVHDKKKDCIEFSCESNSRDLCLSNDSIENQNSEKQITGDWSLVTKYETFLQSSNGHIEFTGTDKSHISLLKLLNKAQAPLSLFREIQTWATDSALKQDVDFKNLHIGDREQIIDNLHEKYDTHGLKPFQKMLLFLVQK